MAHGKVQFFWQADGSTHWARQVSPHAGPGRGFMFMPEVGDEVAVVFEDGDPERPVVLGSVWNGVQQAPRHGYHGEDIPNNDVKRIVTKSGNRIQIADLAGNEAITIATPNHNSLTFSEKHTATGRPLIALSSSGDIVLSAPEGRVHVRSKYFSREVGEGSITSSNGASSGASGAGPPAAAPSEGFFHGLAGGLYGSTLKPLGHMLMHPVETAEGIGHAVAHPVETAQAVGHAVAATGRGVMSGDGRAIGTAIGTVGMFAIPGAGEAEGVEDAARVGQVGEVGEGAAKAAEAEQTGSDIAGTAEASEVGANASVPEVASAEPGIAKSSSGVYPELNPEGGTENCGACADAVDNYLSGKGVQPAEVGPRGWPVNAPADSFTFGHSPQSIEQVMSDAGEGSQGIVHVQQDGSAHVFNIINQNGGITAIDGQTGVHGSLTDVAGYAGYDSPDNWALSQTGK